MEQVKQTAIDWLLENLITEPFSEADFEHNSNCWDKAKEMEKEQIIEAHGDKKRTKSNSGSCVTYAYTFTGEMYYNETFKSE
jgi:hypothetical protein